MILQYTHILNCYVVQFKLIQHQLYLNKIEEKIKKLQGMNFRYQHRTSKHEIDTCRRLSGSC